MNNQINSQSNRMDDFSSSLYSTVDDTSRVLYNGSMIGNQSITCRSRINSQSDLFNEFCTEIGSPMHYAQYNFTIEHIKVPYFVPALYS